MATSVSNSRNLFQIQKPFSLFLVISITYFLLLLNKVNSSDVLSFTFNKFGPHHGDLLLQGDAQLSPKGELQLTKVTNGQPIGFSVGRALYAAPVQIWDSTGSVASFVTSFSFVVKAPNAARPADGIAFFLGPENSQIPVNSSGGLVGGGFLGLFSNSDYNSSNQIVAVEFDSFINSPWDPNVRHIGIDVNTIKSTKTVTWDRKNGEVANVVISYQAAIKTLTASLTYPSSQTSYILSAAVDLKSVLPEWVSVGFSAATGMASNAIETHDVLSWSFTSNFRNSCSIGAEQNKAHLASYA